MSIKSIKENEFETEVANSDLPVLIDFWAEWCGPCKELSPILEEIASEMDNKIKIVKLNIDENPSLPNQHGVQSIPTLIAFKEGKPIATKIGGAVKSEIVSWINTLI